MGSANGIALQLYGPHIQPRHCVIANTDGLTSLTPCHADAHTYVNGQRIYQTTILQHGNLVKFGHSNTYQFLDPSQESRSRHPSTIDSTSVYDRYCHIFFFLLYFDVVTTGVARFFLYTFSFLFLFIICTASFILTSSLKD